VQKWVEVIAHVQMQEEKTEAENQDDNHPRRRHSQYFGIRRAEVEISYLYLLRKIGLNFGYLEINSIVPVVGVSVQEFKVLVCRVLGSIG
jgi:hypothetical protein